MGEKDLIFLGACLILNGMSAHYGMYPDGSAETENELKNAVNASAKLFELVFKAEE